MQNKFAFFANFAETIRATLPLDKQAEAYKAICEFGIYGALPEDPLLKGMCLMACVSIQKADGRSKNGGNHNPYGINQHKKEVNQVNFGQSFENGQSLSETETETETETEAEDTYTDFSDKSSKSGMCVTGDSTAVKKNQKFIPPTVEEVSAYCLERGNGVNPERFVDFYASKGWMVGKSKMKDWRAAVRNWERETPRNNEINTFGDYL